GGGVMYCNLTNCVLTGNTSPDEGGGALSSTLHNCTLNNNSSWVGAGASSCSLYNCLVFSNSASTTYFGYAALTAGGGVAYGSANNCIILGNVVQLDERSSGAVADGGGAYETALNNCTVVDNGVAGGYGGGAYGGSAYNSIIYYNAAVYYVSLVGAGNVTNVTMNYCCTFPTPTSVSGYFNFTNVPSFISIGGTGGNLHLQANSPCINAGNNAYAVGATDLDGNPRIVGGTMDIGAYEYQTPKSAISYAYLQQYGLPTDGSADDADLDGTTFNVYQDWIAGLNPTNPASVLDMLSPPTTNNASGVPVSWESVSGINYNLLRGTNLTSAFTIIQRNIVGQAGTTSYTDATATNGGPYFYQVAVP
ncbi:MAG TPA: choice-of-anchor Q domain-containing protein, partial [Candidatus Acidoferrum sp.]|nr:choice-of-anchor Q domain-containing protein [Candidatus Acidoferrum sp.]